jgi:hypothetical protein
VEAGTMYYALYKFGRHWKFTVKRAKPVKKSELAAQTDQFPRAIPVNPDELNAARDWIRSAEPNLQQIQERADAGLR